VYVESLVRAPIDAVWEATQDPARHQRWDVRFDRISYLPRTEGESQRFTYATRVAPGVTIAGTGESLGDRDRPDGTRWSGLRFRSDDRRSIIAEGAGYWRYVPTDGGARFLTRYDYRPRWGRVGAAIDRRLFRPAFGRATAWSFDRLRLWLEDGVPPERAADRTVAHALAAGGMVGVWLWQGVVPKLWRLDAGELGIWRGLGLSRRGAERAVRASGAVEVALAAATIAGSRHRRPEPFVVALLAMPALAVGAAVADRASVTRAFNPVSLNAAMAALAGVALLTLDGRPSGRRPRREPPPDRTDRRPGEDLP
jgi:hypothetical protein